MTSTQKGIRLTPDQQLTWLRLFRCENVGPQTFLDLIRRYGTAANALDALPDLAAKAGRRKLKLASESDSKQEFDRLHEIGGQLVCRGEPSFPAALRAADGSPPLLSVLGNTDILSRHSIAFVGSRNCSMAGVKFTRILASEVGQSGYAITSGLARGIDSAAHVAALESGTIAVFGGGVNHIYPNENRDLAKAIMEKGGALVSEMPLGWKPRAQDFPRRNRIVAGLSLGLVVVEAARRSGSLISARLANEMGRTVFAVPGSPLDPRSEGANHLIRQGAQLITSAADITSAIDPATAEFNQGAFNFSDNDQVDFADETSDTDRQRLIDALSKAPSDVDELIRFTELPPAIMHTLLLELDLAGIIERHAGNRVSII